MSELQEADSGGGTEEAGEPEVEATLAVTAETPAEVAARIGGLSRIGEHRLEWLGTERLRDVYLDTAGGELRERELAFRLRRSGGSWTLTLKGEARPVAGGGVERSELEVPWSAAGLEEVLEALRSGGLPLSGSPPATRGRDPVESLRSAGFRVVQDRRTLRRSARVLPPDDGGTPLATLVVDTVLFETASGRTVRHREVEVEATPAAARGLPGRIAALLRNRFGDALRPWEHGKLATGAALERIDPPVGPGGDLLPPAYDLLERELSRDGGEGG